MAQRDLAGRPHKDVQAHGENHMDQDHVQQIDIIIGGIKGNREQDQQERNRPEKDHPAFEKPDVFVIVAFHIHDATSGGSRALSAAVIAAAREQRLV